MSPNTLNPNTPHSAAQYDAAALADLERIAAAGVDFNTAHLLASAPVSALNKQAAVLVLFGRLDNTPCSTGALPGCPTAVDESLDVLLLVRAATLRAHAGQPAFPGGKIDPEDELTAARAGVSPARIAALREAVEETGLDPAGVQVLGELQSLPLPVSDFRVTPVLGWWDAPTPVAVVDEGESALIARVPVRDLLNPANRHTAYVGWGASRHTTPAFTVRTGGAEFTVWGFTALVLDSIFEALEWTIPWDAGVLKPAPGYAANGKPKDSSVKRT